MVFAEGESDWAVSMRVFIVQSFRFLSLGLNRLHWEDTGNRLGRYEPTYLPVCQHFGSQGDELVGEGCGSHISE